VEEEGPDLARLILWHNISLAQDQDRDLVGMIINRGGQADWGSSEKYLIHKFQSKVPMSLGKALDHSQLASTESAGCNTEY
jgi:hypothetical protein